MASQRRRNDRKPKGPKIIIPGKAVPERHRYCIEHDTKMAPLLLWDSKTIQYVCKQGCQLSKSAAILK